MSRFETFTFLPLAKWCRPTSDPRQLLEPGNWILTDSPGGFEEFGPMDHSFPGDDTSSFAAAEETSNQFGSITSSHRMKLGDRFVVSLDDVVVQPGALGRPRYHVILAPGLIAAESYGADFTNQLVSESIRETIGVKVGESEIRCRLYDPAPVQGVIDVPFVLGTHMWMTNYCHWMIEALPRFWYLQHQALAGLPVLIPTYPAGSYQRETLDAVLPAGTQGGPMPPVALRFKKLIFPSFISPGGYSRRLVRWLNDKLRPALGVQPAPTGRRLYISREDAKARRLGNEAEVMQALAPLGFESHTLSGKSVREQIELMSGAEMVIFLHGAGMTNLMFAPPTAAVAEIVPRSSVHPMYWFISKMCGQTYGRIVAPDEGPQQTMNVAPAQMLELVQALLDKRRERLAA